MSEPHHSDATSSHGQADTPENTKFTWHEVYSNEGPRRAVRRAYGQRTAATHASFFIPYLQSGMRLLDCGCGPGTITVGLAAIVDPAEVIGIDIADSVLDQARTTALAHGFANLRFEQGNIAQLPFADHSFDAVFAHAVLEHQVDPAALLFEMYRVLKPGGVVGVRSTDWDGHLVAPADPLLAQSYELWMRLSRHNGGNLTVGKHLRALLQQVGFTRIQASASYECLAPQELANTNASALTEGVRATHLVRLGWVNQETLQAMGTAWRRWGEDPTAFCANTWCDAVGWKAA